MFALVIFLAINIVTLDAHSATGDLIESILKDPGNDDHRILLHAFTGYRHRFDQSPNFKELRWNLRNLKIQGLCELCDLGVPVVS